MHILLSNDDGYFAPGLLALYEALQGLGTLTVVAPERDRSGASHSLTLDRPLSLRQNSKGFYYVDGTPTDCVHLAMSGLLKHMPDMVISGINHGANMGDDTVYSGTVAAATEGYMLGLPSIAVSLVGGSKMAHDMENVHGHHFATAGRVVRDIVLRFQKKPWPNLTLLNVNVPDLPFEQIHTTRVTRLGKRHKSEPVISTRNPRNEEVFWIGPPGPALDADDGTDFHALERQEISITPLRMDLTDNKAIVGLGQWLVT